MPFGDLGKTMLKINPRLKTIALSPLRLIMLQEAAKTGYGPNVSTDAQNFFQSDIDIANLQKKEAKREALGEAGDPLTLPSKVLCLALSNAQDGPWVYVGESGFVARKMHREVCSIQLRSASLGSMPMFSKSILAQ